MGLAVGLVQMVLVFVYGTPSCGEIDIRPAFIRDVHYLYFALILLALTGLVITAVSLCTPAIPEHHVRVPHVLIINIKLTCKIYAVTYEIHFS